MSTFLLLLIFRDDSLHIHAAHKGTYIGTRLHTQTPNKQDAHAHAKPLLSSDSESRLENKNRFDTLPYTYICIL